MKKRQRPSYAFLMEMMWVCAFFLICACIFVLAFAKAEQMSRKAETLNKATLAASNAMEDVYAAFDGAVSGGAAGTAGSGSESDTASSGSDAASSGPETGTANSDSDAASSGPKSAANSSPGSDAADGGPAGFAAEVESIRANYSSETFTLDIRTDITDGLLTVVVEATDVRDGEVLCTLNGARAALSSARSDGMEASAAIAAEGRPL